MNGCHQNASPTSWYKHHNNPHHSSPSLTSYEFKICVLVTNMLIEGQELCEVLMDYCAVLWAVWTLKLESLQKIHWWASDVMFNFSKTNLFTSWMAWGRVSTSSEFFYFWVTIPLTCFYHVFCCSWISSNEWYEWCVVTRFLHAGPQQFWCPSRGQCDHLDFPCA